MSARSPGRPDNYPTAPLTARRAGPSWVYTYIWPLMTCYQEINLGFKASHIRCDDAAIICFSLLRPFSFDSVRFMMPCLIHAVPVSSVAFATAIILPQRDSRYLSQAFLVVCRTSISTGFLQMAHLLVHYAHQGGKGWATEIGRDPESGKGIETNERRRSRSIQIRNDCSTLKLN